MLRVDNWVDSMMVGSIDNKFIVDGLWDRGGRFIVDVVISDDEKNPDMVFVE